MYRILSQQKVVSTIRPIPFHLTYARSKAWPKVVPGHPGCAPAAIVVAGQAPAELCEHLAIARRLQNHLLPSLYQFFSGSNRKCWFEPVQSGLNATRLVQTTSGWFRPDIQIFRSEPAQSGPNQRAGPYHDGLDRSSKCGLNQTRSSLRTGIITRPTRRVS